MLDSEGFIVAAGWVHDLLLHSFVVNDLRKFVIKAKVDYFNTYEFVYYITCVRLITLSESPAHHCCHG